MMHGGIYFVPAFMVCSPLTGICTLGNFGRTDSVHDQGAYRKGNPGSDLLSDSEVLQAMERDSQVPLKSLKVDGGASETISSCNSGGYSGRPKSSGLWLMKPPHWGGLCGRSRRCFWNSLDELRSNWGVDRVLPTVDKSRREEGFWRVEASH